MEIKNKINVITKYNIGDVVYRVIIVCKDDKCFWKIKKEIIKGILLQCFLDGEKDQNPINANYLYRLDDYYDYKEIELFTTEAEAQAECDRRNNENTTIKRIC